MRGMALSSSIPGAQHGLCSASQSAHHWVYRLQIQWRSRNWSGIHWRLKFGELIHVHQHTKTLWNSLSSLPLPFFLSFLKAFSWASLDFCHTWPYFQLSCWITPPLSPLQLSSPPPPAHACDLHPSHLPCIVPHPSPFCIYLFIYLPQGWKWGKNKNKYANEREKTERNLIKMCVFLSLRVL